MMANSGEILPDLAGRGSISDGVQACSGSFPAQTGVKFKRMELIMGQN